MTLSELKRMTARQFSSIKEETLVLKYIDDDSDTITLSNEIEIQEFYNILKNQNEITILVEGQIDEDKGKEEKEEKTAVQVVEEKEEIPIHKISCDLCGKRIEGIRWKCANCREFNLCSICEKDSFHSEGHVFMKIKRPVQRNSFEPINLFYYVEEEISPEVEEEQEEEDEDYSAELVGDVSFPDKSKVESGTKFTKIWEIRNIGKAWNDQVHLRWISGDFRGEQSEKIQVKSAKRNQIVQVSVDLVSPSQPGNYVGYWRLYHGAESFGSRFWCQIIVPDSVKVGKQEEQEKQEEQVVLDQIYGDKIDELSKYGFSDQYLSLQALKENDGDIIKAIEWLTK